MSGIYDMTLTVGASGQVPAMGALVKVYSAPGGPVRVKLDGGEAFTLLEGQGVRLPDGKTFRDVTVQNLAGVTQLVQLFVGDSRFEDTRITGNVRIVDEVSDRIVSQQMVPGFAVTAWGALQVIDPALNLRGAIVRQLSLASAAGAGGYVNNQWIVAKSTPTGYTTPAQSMILQTLSNSTTANVNSPHLLLNKFLPVGWGLWFTWVTNTALATGNTGFCATEVL